jgi:hypothetical protein
MPSRRSLLSTAGAAALVALAGCQSGDNETTTSTDSTATTTTSTATTETTTTPSGTYLDTSPVAEPARVVPHQEPVVVASQLLYDLAVEAAASEQRVDAPMDIDLDREQRLALGDFRYVQFQGETYEPAASFAAAYSEASYQYEGVPVNQSEVEADATVVEYSALNGSERAIADAMLNDSYSVGLHESRPAAAESFEPQSYLRAGNETYRVRVVVGDAAAHHMLTLTASGAGPQVAVPVLADRAPEPAVAEVLQRAVAEGPVALGDDEAAVRDYLGDAEYVVTAGGVFAVQVVEPVE